MKHIKKFENDMFDYSARYYSDENNVTEYNDGEYVYTKLFGGKMCKILNRDFTHTNIEYYNDSLDEFEHFKIYQSDIVRKLTAAEIEEYLEFKKEFELRKEGEQYNL